MSRTVKAPEVRRNEILDTAQELFYAKGYEQTSIRDIIDGVGIAKGTFYHYFPSKTELLDELIERMIVQIMQTVEPIAEDENLDALQKFQLFFSTVQNWKIQNKTFLKDLLRVFFSDDNVLLRYKLKVSSVSHTNAILSRIIHQGIEEGIFQTEYPDEISSVLIEVGQSLSENLATLILEKKTDDVSMRWIKRKIAVTNNSIERLLGAPTGSIKIFEYDHLIQWLDPEEGKQAQGVIPVAADTAVSN